MGVPEFVHVTLAPDVEEIRSLLVEYGQSLNFNLCFQSFDEELRSLPGPYGPPRGRLVLARIDGFAVGCIAMKPLDAKICEMKRLYVRPQFRGRHLGKALASRLIDDARATGYRSMRLDTIRGAMDPAIALYRAIGFREIPPYYPNPIPDALYFELTF
jgi:putative acetyltransferase